MSTRCLMGIGLFWISFPYLPSAVVGQTVNVARTANESSARQDQSISGSAPEQPMNADSFLSDAEGDARRGQNEREMRRSPNGRRDSEDQWFDPDWWYEPPNRDRRPQDPWFDPGWWHEWPDDPDGGRDRPDYRPPPRPYPPRDRYDDWSGDRPPYFYPQRRAAMGVMLTDTSRRGAAITAIVPGGPAQRSRLRAGDVIIAIEGRSIDDYRDAVNTIRRYEPGQRVRVHFLRDGRLLMASVTLDRAREVF